MLNFGIGFITYCCLHHFYEKMIKSPKFGNFQNANLCYSGVHAILTALISFMYVYNYLSSITYTTLLAISPAYAIFDIEKILQPQNFVNTKAMLVFHHSMIIFFYILLSRYYSDNETYVYYIALNYLSEITTPLLNLSIFLNKIKMTDNIFFTINSGLLLLSYFVYRIIIPGFVGYSLYLDGNYFAIPQVMLSSMNWFWFYKLCLKAREFL